MMKWPMVKLGSLMLEERSGASLTQDEFTSSGIPVVPKKAISESVNLCEDTFVYTSKEKFEACSNAQVSKEFLITTLRNLNPDGSTLGLICRNNFSGELMLAQGMHAFILKDNVDPNYVCHASRHPKFRNEIQRIKVGSTQVHIRARELKEIKIPLPPFAEQKRIAAILDKADELRRKRREAMQLADDFLRAVFLDMFGDPVANPKGWPVLPMGDVIDFKGGSQPPKEKFSDEPLPGYVRLVQIRDFKTDKYKTYIPERLAKRSFDVDDVMVARYGPPVFQVLRGLSGSYNVALMKAQPKENVLKEVAFWLLQMPFYQDAVVANSERTAGQTGVNLDFLNNLQVPLPPLHVQEKIAERTVGISKMLAKQQSMLNELESKFEAMQADFFS